jgi:hypothetical protein
MNRQACGKKKAKACLKYYPNNYLKGQRKIAKTARRQLAPGPRIECRNSKIGNGIVTQSDSTSACIPFAYSFPNPKTIISSVIDVVYGKLQVLRIMFN